MAHSHSHDQADAEEEQLHFANVIATFQNIRALSANNRRRKDFFTLPKADRELLAGLGYKDELDKVDAAIVANAEFLAQVVAEPEISRHDLGAGAREGGGGGRGRRGGLGRSGGQHANRHARTVIRTRTRMDVDTDTPTCRGSGASRRISTWTSSAARSTTCCTPMTTALLTHFAAVPRAERPHLRVLVPGAGLGDVAALGFTCQGNEFSHYMLLASHFLLNRRGAGFLPSFLPPRPSLSLSIHSPPPAHR
ncbi:hypothetical protein B0H11DRAFT_2238112 [Mycena galericulata]|nr:hypothetical protein B0H11DRAFT_2238112 [Mycena galericulata]